jgi:hypothetical protein
MVLEHSIEHSCATAVACNDEYTRRVFIQTMNNSTSHDDQIIVSERMKEMEIKESSTVHHTLDRQSF